MVIACCPWPSPLGAVQLVPRSATQCHGGKGRARTRGCACSPTYTTLSGYGVEELNVPTPYSRGVALGLPLPKEGQPARGWRKNRKMKMQELPFLRSKRSKWEGHRRLKVGLNEQRCMGVFGVLGLTAYHRFPPLNPLTDGWWVTHMRWVPALKPSKRVRGTTRGNGKHTI